MSGPRLNPHQAEAVNHIRGPLLIFAGAGSGKTRVITHRIQHMLGQGIASSCIVAVSFTNKSAREMKHRLQKMVGSKALRGMVLSTFHALGNRILQKEIRVLGYRDPFSILDSDDGLQLYASIYRDLKLDPDQVKEDSMPFMVSLCKNSNMHHEDWAGSRSLPVSAGFFCDVYERYHASLKSLNAVDFDDLILLPSRIFKEYPEILDKYRRRFRYFMIDEFQDTNPTQYELLLSLVGDEKNLCVVGDDDQSIYGWRGADVGIIQNFQTDFPDAKIVRLEHNYRSSSRILSAANAVIANNSKRVQKTLRATGEEGEQISVIMAEDEEQEAMMVADIIQNRIIHAAQNPGDFAILYRTNFQSRAFEQELRKLQIPHHVVGGYKFFDRKEVKDLLAYLRVIANRSDEISLLRILNRPRRGIGEGSVQKIGAFLQSMAEEADASGMKRPDFFHALERIGSTPGLIQGIPSKQVSAIYEFVEFIEKYKKEFSRARKLAPVLSTMIQELNWEHEFMREGSDENAVRARMLNLSELTNMLAFFESNWEDSTPPGLFDFLARISLQASDEDDDNPRGRVQLLTLHLSKGLEFPTVFLTGMMEGIFPGERSISESDNPEAALEEERRLCYVGITRAMKKLFLTASRTRRRFGETEEKEPSRFLDEIPEELLDREDHSVTQVAERKRDEMEEWLTDLRNNLKVSL
ncbi:MAG: damage-inducible protein [Spirochaetaceae bacterium]|nr:damage-inducible protein [Spirochaetaceae bacterium]